MIQVSGIKLKIGESTDRLPAKVESRLRVPKGTVDSVRIVKESLDAREKPALYRVYTLEIGSEKTDEWLTEACRRTNTQWAPVKRVRKEIRPLLGVSEGPCPVVVGFGPCGMFAALALSEYGLKPIVLERGGSMDERVAAVERFWNGGPLDPECNVQFGEGGAGTFSDGKLTTGTRSPWSEWILERFVDAGASPQILYKQKPHIGTDVLRAVVVNIRKRIESLGGQVLFGCRLEKLDVAEERSTGDVKGKPERSVRGVWYSEKGSRNAEQGTQGAEQGFAESGLKYLPADRVILALGHSARDTVRALFGQGLCMEQKPFSMGVRIEHPQDLIDMAQYAAFHEELGIGPADYKLNVKTASGRGVYTFCMCPGGYVINASSRPGMLVTNGMSNSDRGSGTANSALLADVLPGDYAPQYLPDGTDPADPLAGMAFQEKYERLAFELGGSNYCAPVQTVGSFLGEDGPATQPNRAVEDPGCPVAPTFRPGTVPADLSECLPDFVCDALREALPKLGRKLHGFDDPGAVMTGIESRSSSPVRIRRSGKNLQALAAGSDPESAAAEQSVIRGLYPAGEGAGYAGGIMSAAADGVRIAETIARSTLLKDIKLIALDLDGTVLTDEKVVTQRTADAIKAAIARGFTVVPVTGRPVSGLPTDLVSIPGIRYIIASNGAITAELDEAPAAKQGNAPAAEPAASAVPAGTPGACTSLTAFRSIRSEFLSRDTAEAITALCTGRSVTFNLFIDGEGCCLPDSYNNLIERFTGTPLDDYVRKSRRLVEDIPTLLASSGSRVENIWIKAHSTEERDELSLLLRQEYGVNTVLTAPTDVEVGSLPADKGLALTALAEKLGISRRQILAIGDNDNDLGMLRAAGTAVAMGNATESVKEMADFTAPSHNEDGVAAVLEALQ